MAGAMRVVFVGSSRFGLRCLEHVRSLQPVELAGVVTAPAVFPISYRPEGVVNVLHAEVASYAAEHGLAAEVIHTGMKDPGLLSVVRSWEPDIFLVAGWYHMVPLAWRELAPAYGLHASLLPDYSGGAPLVWAMINGETKTGITLFQMDEGVDSGPIVAQAEEPIYEDDTIATLYARIEERGLELLGEALPAMAAGRLTLRAQDDSKRRVMPQRSPDDGRIDWRRDAGWIDRFIRAQTRPYPGAFGELKGERLTIWSAHPAPSDGRGEIGRVSRDRDGYVVACGEGRLVLEQVRYRAHEYGKTELSEIFQEGGQALHDFDGRPGSH